MQTTYFVEHEAVDTDELAKILTDNDKMFVSNVSVENIEINGINTVKCTFNHFNNYPSPANNCLIEDALSKI